MPRLILPALALLTLTLAACGQTTSLTSPANVQPELQSNLQLTLFVPAASTVGPQYISASTTSLRIQVGDIDQNFQLSDGTPVNGGTQYRFAVKVAPGPQQVVKISTFNAQNQLLSQAAQSLDLAPGGTNTFDLTLVGEAVTAGLTFDANSNVTSGPSVLLDRGGAYTLGSALKDASGNTILDAGRPTDILCSSDGTFTISGGNGAFTLNAPEPIDVAQNTILTAHVGDCTTPTLGQISVSVPAEQITVTLPNATPDVSSPLIATASLKTAQGNALPVAGRNITFTVTEQNAQISTFSGVTDAAGQLTTTAQSALLTGGTGGTTGTVTASSGAVSGLNTYTSASACGTLVNLAVGQVQHFSGTAATKLCLPGGTAARQSYAVIPVNNTSTAQTLSVKGTGIAASDITANSLKSEGQGIGTLSLSSNASALVETPAPTMSTASLNALMSRPAARLNRSIQSQAVTYGLPQGSVPAVDSVIALNVAQGCAGTPDVRFAQVRAVTNRAIVLEEVVQNSSTGAYSPAVVGGLGKYDYEGIGKNFDITYDTLTPQFGAPADMDGNGHVAIFYTKAMNELSAPATSTITYGQFNSRDLFAKTTAGCALSNQGELMYMAVADPTGQVNSNVRTSASIVSASGQTLAGEFTRLINASRRLYVTNAPALEEPWLDQGLADEGRMLMFYRATAGQMYSYGGTLPAPASWTQGQAASCGPLAPLSNIALSNLTSGACASIRVSAFNTYANYIFSKFKPYLQRPDLYSIYTTGNTITSPFTPVSPAQPFLQYSADRVVSTNSDQRAFWSSLIDSKLQGLANLQNAIGGVDPKTWVRDWSVSNTLDDKALTGGTVEAKYQMASWNWRSVFGGLGGFPLLSRPLTDATALTLAYAPGSTSYMVLGVSAGQQGTVTVTDPNNTLATDVSVSIIRLK